MARTYRRRRERHEDYWVLHDWESRLPFGHWVQLDPRSKAGRKAVAHFHSDKTVTLRSSAPRWYRKTFALPAADAGDRERFLSLYQIDNDDFSCADLIIDTEQGDQYAVAEKIVARIRSMKL